MTCEKIFILEEDEKTRQLLKNALEAKRFEITFAENDSHALEILSQSHFDLLFLNNLEMIKAAKKILPESLIIFTTTLDQMQRAVDGIRLGAFNYLIKPFGIKTLETILEKAKNQAALLQQHHFLCQEITQNNHRNIPARIIAMSPSMQRIIHDLSKIAKSNTTVFINGESGTGKEIIAQAIHFQSKRSQAPFIKVNCAAIPEPLIESEFFGHEKGSFTGAIQRRIGRFELADKGTLLLDEISEIPANIQSKLLRAIQEKEFERVGGSKPIQVDVRLISTSNRNMKEAISQKAFREDLYYRLNVIPIFLPPLRERREDILPLADYFLDRLSIESHKQKKQLSDAAKKKLLEYSWPGNIRELANIIERTVVMDCADLIQAEHLTLDSSCNTETIIKPSMNLKELEKRHILEVLATYHQNKTKAAKALGINIRTLRNKLHSYTPSK